MADKIHNVDIRTGTIVIPTSDTVSAGTVTFEANGEVKWLEFLTANMEDTDSTNFIITSSAGGTLYASGTKAESTRFTAGTVFPLFGTMKAVAVAEGTQSAARSVPFSIYYES